MSKQPFWIKFPGVLPAISLWQPWASLVALGVKTVENRTWSTTYRGPLLIHAGGTQRRKAFSDAWRLCARAGGMLPIGDDFVRYYAYVGVVDLDEIVTDSSSIWAAPKSFHWVLSNPRPLAKPIMTRGFQKLWNSKLTLQDLTFREAA